MAAPICILLEFGGGAELLFRGIKKHHVTLPDRLDPWDIRQLLVWIKENLLKERPELFIQGDTVRPGILVLINDADWELMIPLQLNVILIRCGIGGKFFHMNSAGELDYKLRDQDNIVFISTLHGG